ncbi:MAG: hypothetical protein RI907_39 [Pseudomonadota bacterium]|jgi:hypothetical protein
MNTKRLSAWCLGVALLVGPVAAWAGVVLVGHASVHKVDQDTVQRIYSGRMIEVGGVAVSPVHLPASHPARQRFMADVLQQTEEQYLAYWTVRRYVGKGTPPPELRSVGEALAHVARTPGGLAYVDEADVPAGANVIWKR